MVDHQTPRIRNSCTSQPSTIMENPFSCNSCCRGAPLDFWLTFINLLPDQGHGEHYCNGECHWRNFKTVQMASMEYKNIKIPGICVKN